MKKVKALIDCSGLGYNLKSGEETELKEQLADKLTRFGYVEEIKENDGSDEKENVDGNEKEEVKAEEGKKKRKQKEKGDK